MTWPHLAKVPSKPRLLLVSPHYDDESNAGGGLRHLIIRGVGMDSIYLTEGEDGKGIRRDASTGMLVQEKALSPVALSRERHGESRRFQRLLGVDYHSTMTTLRGNPDIDPFEPGARQDTAYLLDPETGRWMMKETTEALIRGMAELRPIAIVTLSHDGAVHQAHRATHELVEQAAAAFAQHYGVDSPGVFGMRETGWAADDELEPVDQERSIRLDLDDKAQQAKRDAVITAFPTQPPGHPDDYDYFRSYEVLIPSENTTLDQIQAMRELFNRKPQRLSMARQALTKRIPMLGPRSRTVLLGSDDIADNRSA